MKYLCCLRTESLSGIRRCCAGLNPAEQTLKLPLTCECPSGLLYSSDKNPLSVHHLSSLVFNGSNWGAAESKYTVVFSLSTVISGDITGPRVCSPVKLSSCLLSQYKFWPSPVHGCDQRPALQMLCKDPLASCCVQMAGSVSCPLVPVLAEVSSFASFVV